MRERKLFTYVVTTYIREKIQQNVFEKIVEKCVIHGV